MAEFNRHTFPSGGGWVFRQSQTGWVNPNAMVGFDASVKAIVQHRQGNKAIAAKYGLSTNPVVVADELEKYTRLRLGIPLQAPSSFFSRASNQSSSRVAGVAAVIRRAAQGTSVVLDWLTSGGKPVTQELANKRASICVGCPKNVPGAWYTTAPAELIRSTLSARSDLKLETKFDSQLQSCDVCRCLLPLKIWCPMDHILKGTTPEVMEEFPPACWIKNSDK